MEDQSKTKATSNLEGLISQTVQKNQTTRDMETAPAAPGKWRSNSKIQTMRSIQRIYRNMKEMGYHVDKEKRLVYKKLMDHLDDIEEKYSKITLILMTFEIVVFSGLTAFLVCSLTVESIKHRRLLGLRWWQWITMAMMLFSGVSVVRFLTFVVSWPITWWWRTHKDVVFFVRQLKRCVDVTICFCLVLLGWYVWFRPRLKHVRGDVSIIAAHQVTRFLIALCLGSFLWLLKNIVYLKLEADLHYHQLFDRLRQSIVYLNGILILDGKVTGTFLTYNQNQKPINSLMKIIKRKLIKSEKSEDLKVKNIWMDVLMMSRDSVPIWILRRLSEEYLDVEKFRRHPEADEILNDDEKLLTEAKNMFKRITGAEIDQFHQIKRENLEKFELSVPELDYLFKYKDYEERETDGGAAAEKTIAPALFLNWAVRALKNCWGLERTLESSKIALVKLNRLLSAFLVALVLIIWLLLSKIVTTAQLALLFAPFLAASFIFENSFKNMFQGLIFAFAVHPFDVGDRVIIDDAQMMVKELNILTSVFFKYDTGADVIYPNSTLAMKKIVNLDITPDQSDKLDFVVNEGTPPEDVNDLELRIKKLLDEDVQYSSGTKVVKNTDGTFNPKEALKMTVHFKYLVSYLTAERKAEHKSKILGEIMRFRKEMEQNNKENKR